MDGNERKVAGAAGNSASTGSALGVGEMIISGPAMHVYAKGAKFPAGQTGAATQKHISKAAQRHETVITAIRFILAKDLSCTFRHAGGAKAGQPNASKLANFNVESKTMNSPLGFNRVRGTIKKAVEECILE
jgi:hypothetical protein